MADEPIYYAKDDTIYKRPIRTPKEGGGATVSLGFPVCTVSEFVGTDGVAAILEAFNSKLT